MVPAASYTKNGIHMKQLKVLKIFNYKFETRVKEFLVFHYICLVFKIGGSQRNDNKIKCEMYKNTTFNCSRKRNYENTCREIAFNNENC